jgi:hypothetical protein
VGEDEAAHPARVGWMLRAGRIFIWPERAGAPMASQGLARRDAVHRFGRYSVVWSAVLSRFQQGWEDGQGPAMAYLDTDLLTRAMGGEQMEIPPAGIAARHTWFARRPGYITNSWPMSCRGAAFRVRPSHELDARHDSGGITSHFCPSLPPPSSARRLVEQPGAQGWEYYAVNLFAEPGYIETKSGCPKTAQPRLS